MKNKFFTRHFVPVRCWTQSCLYTKSSAEMRINMSKKKRQQFGTIFVLCGVLIVLGIGYLFASRYQSMKEEEESETEIELYSMKEDEVIRLHYTNGTADITLVKEDDVWKLESDKEFPVEQSKIETMVGDVAAVSASRLVTKDCQDLSEYELEEPKLVITLTDSDGKEQQISYGLETAAAGGCYAYTDDSKIVYVVPSNVTSDFEYTQNQLMELPDAPEIDEDRVTFYAVQTAKGEKFTAKSIEATEDDASEEQDESDEESEDETSVDWEITKSTGKVTDYDMNYMETILYTLTDLSAAEGVSYQASASELKKYGLVKPAYTLTVKYDIVKLEDSDEDTKEEKVSQTFKMYVGSGDTTKQYYYVSFEGEKGIYLMSAETVDTLIDIVK